MFWLFKKLTKEAKVFRILSRNQNKWVSALDIVKYASTLHHTSLIMRLRKKHNIENKIIWENWTKLSFYKLTI